MLVCGSVLERVALHVFLRESAAGFDDDERKRLLALDLVRHRHDARLRDIGMTFQQMLDFAWKYIFAAAHEHVVGAPNEKIGAVGIASKYVTGNIPAVCGEHF